MIRFHWSVKVLAVILVFLSTLGLILGAVGVIIGSADFQGSTPDVYNLDQDLLDSAAENIIGQYLIDHSNIPEEYYRTYGDWWGFREVPVEFDYRMDLPSGHTLDRHDSRENYAYIRQMRRYINKLTLTILPEGGDYPSCNEYINALPGTQKNLWPDFPTIQQGTEYYYLLEQEDGSVHLLEVGPPEYYFVELYATAEALEPYLGVYEASQNVYRFTREYSAYFQLATIVSGCILLGSLCAMTAIAGCKSGTGAVAPIWTNQLPLDLHLAVFGGGMVLVVLWLDTLMNDIRSLSQGNESLWLMLLTAVALLAGLLLAVLFPAIGSQGKMGKGFWWQNTIVVRFTRFFILKPCTWLGKNGWSFAKRWVSLLPLWLQWLVLGLIAWLLGPLGLIIPVWMAYCFSELRSAAKKMSEGDLNAKVDLGNPILQGSFRSFAGNLNDLSAVCVESAKSQMKSERMRSELITNVSHDIKTPLTSIINYVDLLEKADTEAQRTEYLQVLRRQSARMKRLIEDLMEMSKASSGNLQVDLQQIDAVESLNQAMGEFSDRLTAQGLQLVMALPETPVMIRCDGRLLWRVLSNCLTNVVKYALPGTRVYLELTQAEQHAQMVLKNISAQPLNVAGDELMERFVRGDASRNTEGNGLGLNIAKSLMEAQGGTLEAVVDGDLFKLILTLPKI